VNLTGIYHQPGSECWSDLYIPGGLFAATPEPSEYSLGDQTDEHRSIAIHVLKRHIPAL
jgi:hypothetical protein